MKNLFCFLIMLVIYFPLSANDSLQTVVAPSGLKLRALPSMQGEVLAVLPHLADLRIRTGENFLPVEDEVGFFRGEWVYVQYEDLEGYVFNSLLSDLPMPLENFEKTQYHLDLIYPLEAWMDFHQEGDMSVDTFTTKLYSKLIYNYANGNRMEKKSTDLSYSVKILFQETSISEIYYLLYNMLNTEEEIEAFVNNTLYIKGKSGIVDQIKINLEDAVVIKEKSNGVELMISTPESGCVY